MALSKISELRELSDEDVREGILSCKKELFELRVQKATRQLEKVHTLVHAKHKLAQLMTVAAERKRSLPSG
ncbi:50S ribosomal protein L29 [Candidatus Cyanaurora vandensis]|uniref:50S ribosomal protein L29 n=1 Tax=Candidatus Cyanaurora vandensis TaxID=2714958 RepID=UPI00257D58C6|nr:50S ribosomal protein L29 [Candidatus Cyanaurora vandensis]